ncbi:hypothetical protein IV203_025486 [Nitzschia inconspicua]|uniref:Uncharacterized protein n=1 Tax=Nitzschia inconspicua TaxID=303405 RepID=A0A9K3PAG6_9STRA|nr:hypothetical protein IV203_028266 [Nitzschia inconspicua]KAG7362602.1 hypothetical protein IV203_025486 [Nitzschia inconspicua]
MSSTQPTYGRKKAPNSIGILSSPGSLFSNQPSLPLPTEKRPLSSPLVTGDDQHFLTEVNATDLVQDATDFFDFL